METRRCGRRRGTQFGRPRDPGAGGRTPPTDDQVEGFKPLLLKDRQGTLADIRCAAEGDYAESEELKKPPLSTRPKVDIVEAFEAYCSQPHIKGGLNGPTAKRWRSVIEHYIEWIKHGDLARVTP